MTKEGKYLYMEVTKDKYELPVIVADSIAELSVLSGIPKNVISSACCHHEHNMRTQFVRVDVERRDKMTPEQEEELKECKKRKADFVKMLKNIDLMKLAIARSIALEDLNIKEIVRGEE